MTSPQPPEERTSAKRAGRSGWHLAYLLIGGMTTGFWSAIACQFVWADLTDNLHTVIRDRVYRSGQMSPEALEVVIQRYGIRTVINLRGCCDPMPWYVEECRTTQRLGIQHADVGLSANRPVSATEVRRLLELVDRAEYPILLHCFRGSDRTGLAASLVLLLQSDLPLHEARKQLDLRYGHIPWGRTAFMNRYLDSYAEWLQQEGREHSKALLREWLNLGESAPDCRCRVEPIEVPSQVAIGHQSSVRVRMHNAGRQSWQMLPGSGGGTHAAFVLYDPDGMAIVGQSGLFHAVVHPGSHIDLTLPLPALAKPGRHHLLIDMSKKNLWFHQTGSEPLELEIETE